MLRRPGKLLPHQVQEFFGALEELVDAWRACGGTGVCSPWYEKEEIREVVLPVLRAGLPPALKALAVRTLYYCKCCVRGELVAELVDAMLPL